MPVRNANAKWEGDLEERPRFDAASAAAPYEGQYSFSTRFENGKGTNPEELIAAAHAGCFSMALANGLTQAGHAPTKVETTAKVHLEKGEAGFGIPKIELVTEAVVPGIDEAKFRELAETAKKNCPVSKVLAAAEITLDAKLVG